jgi:hypothetical protein
MRMLMGANDIYADGKVQSMTTNGWDKFYYKFKKNILNIYFYFFIKIEDQSNKRSISPNDKCEKLEYLIRDALDRECPPLIKRDGKILNKIK